MGVVRLRDSRGLRPEPVAEGDGGGAEVSATDASVDTSGISEQDGAFEQREAVLRFWQRVARARSGLATLRMFERTACAAEIRTIDASQTLLHVDALATPMGTYPHATVRCTDVLAVHFDSTWRVSPQLPPIPAALRARPAEPPRAAVDGSDELEAAKCALERRLAEMCVAETAGEEAGGDELASGSAAAAGSAAHDWDPRSEETRKYWVQRYMLFSRFDEGVRLDREGWFSVTPEALAEHMAERCRSDLIVDAFAGVGGNAIQFAFTCERVIAIDIDPDRLAIAAHNAAVYGVADRIQFICADFMAIAHRLRADVVFLSPPWGGPAYARESTFDLDTMMGGLDGAAVLRAALGAAPNAAYFLPKNVDRRRVRALAREAGVPVEIERCQLNGRDKGVVAYYGFDEADE